MTEKNIIIFHTFYCVFFKKNKCFKCLKSNHMTKIKNAFYKNLLMLIKEQTTAILNIIKTEVEKNYN